MQEVFEKIIEELEDDKSNVPVNRLLDDIIKDKPKELGQLMAYDDAIKIVQEVEEEYKKETYFNLDNVTLHKCPKCGGNAQHRVNQKGSWACGCFECGLFKSDYDHQKAIQEWEDYCKEYNNGWIPCSERLPEPIRPVLVTLKNWMNDKYFVRLGRFHTDHWKTDEGIVENSVVIAWQPLPEPYQPKGE